MKTTKVGIVGCGMISDTYFKASQKFRNLEVIACSDIIPERSAKNCSPIRILRSSSI